MSDSPRYANAHEVVVAAIRDGVRRLYGKELTSTVLYGSRARGDCRPDSDYDVAVFLDTVGDLDRELTRLAELAWEIQRATGAIVSFLPFPASSRGDRNLPMNAIRAEGVAL